LDPSKNGANAISINETFLNETIKMISHKSAAQIGQHIERVMGRDKVEHYLDAVFRTS